MNEPHRSKNLAGNLSERIAGCLDNEQIMESVFQKCTENQFFIITLVKYFYH